MCSLMTLLQGLNPILSFILHILLFALIPVLVLIAAGIGSVYLALACGATSGKTCCTWISGACCWCIFVFPMCIVGWAILFVLFFCLGVPLAYISFIYFCGRKVCCMWNPCIGCCKRRRRKPKVKNVPKKSKSESINLKENEKIIRGDTYHMEDFIDEDDLEEGLIEKRGRSSDVLLEEPD